MASEHRLQSVPSARPPLACARAGGSGVSLGIAFAIAFMLFLLNAAVNLAGPLHRFFGGLSRFRITAWLINLLFLWLAVLLWLAFLRWRRTERERRELNRILSSISPDALLVVSPDRTILACNRSVERLLGYAPQEVIGRKTDCLYYDRRRSGAGKEIYETLRRQGFHVGLATGKHKSGADVPLEIITAELSRHEGAVLLLRDLTEQLHEEEAHRRLQDQLRHQRKLESLGVLAGGVAHDFNNLLAAIVGNAELAARQLAGAPAAARSLEQIREAAQRAAHLCRDMLLYAGKGRRQISRLSLAEVVRSLTHILCVTIPRHVAVNYEIEDGAAVDGDAAQLRQMLLCLVANAVEALGQNEGLITIRAGERECDAAFLAETLSDAPLSPGRWVVLEVLDNGPGLDAATQARLFEPFFSTKPGHRGLGLPSVRGLVRAHGGGIRVQSSPGRGCRVTVLFPPARAAESAPAATPPPAAEPDAPATDDWRGAGQVLLVEDDEAVGACAEQALRGAGLTVLRARDGAEGLRLFGAHQHALQAVVLDLTLPKLSGRLLFEEMRRLKPRLPVILCSGDAYAAAGLGPAPVLAKPYTLPAFLQAIRAALEPAAPPMPGGNR